MTKSNTRAALWTAFYLHHIEANAGIASAAKHAEQSIRALLEANPLPAQAFATSEEAIAARAAHEETVMTSALHAFGTTPPSYFEPIVATLDTEKAPAWAEHLSKQLDALGLRLGADASEKPIVIKAQDAKSDQRSEPTVVRDDSVPPFVRDIARQIFGRDTDIEFVKVSPPNTGAGTATTIDPNASGAAAPKDVGKSVLQLIAYGDKRAEIVLGGEVFVTFAQGPGDYQAPAYLRALEAMTRLTHDDLNGAMLVAPPAKMQAPESYEVSISNPATCMAGRVGIFAKDVAVQEKLARLRIHDRLRIILPSDPH